VDDLTGKVTVVNYVAAVDCGVSINPNLVRGQVMGQWRMASGLH